MKTLLIALTLFAVTSTATADDFYVKRRPSGRYDVRDSYGNSIGSMKRTPTGRYRIQTYDYYQAPRYDYYYTTPYRAAYPGLYYQFNADGSYQWQYSY